MDESNFVQISEDSEDALGLQLDNEKHSLQETNLDSILNDDPDLFTKELEQIKSSSRMHHKVKHHAKAHAKHKHHQKMKSEHKLKHKTEQKSAIKMTHKQEKAAKKKDFLMSQSKEAEKEWMNEMAAFKALEKSKLEMKTHNEALTKMKQKEEMKAEHAAEVKAEVAAEVAAKQK